ncbi:MAG: metal ABC transporter permease [candidate division Zixibacteria bacterium]|jgi:zinc transport system permease protein|nr:metal ABC transporter permease [candidate division Zixibacteria bacterium]
MIEIIRDLWQYDFLRHALFAGILASVACGIIGAYIVVKRIVFIAGGISHTAYGGIGLGYFLGFNPIIGAIIFSLAGAGGIALIRQKARQLEDTLIGIMWALGMAIGIMLIDKTPGYAPNLMSYLFGNILTVPTYDLFLMAVLDIVIFAAVALLFKEFQALTFDEEYAEISGLPVAFLNSLLLCLIAMTVVILIRIVGIILIIALLTIPAAITIQFSHNLKKMMIYSVLLGIIFTTSGLILSETYNITSGATIIFIACASYAISLLIRWLIKVVRK